MNNLFFISHQFDFFDLVWKRRCCNKAAHTLAKSLCPIFALQDWLDSPPDALVAILIADSSH